MNKVFISPEAERDLSQIKQYISTELKKSIVAFAADVSGLSHSQVSKKLDKLIKNNQFIQ